MTIRDGDRERDRPRAGAFSGLTITLFMIGIAVNTTASNWFALAMLYGYEIAFSTSWVPIPWLLGPEVTPLHLRHIGGAIGPFSEWLFTFVRDVTFLMKL
jgi:hypothetical protein